MILNGLSKKQRTAIILKERGMTDQQIAAATGMKDRVAVNRLRHRGYRRIRDAVKVFAGLEPVDSIVQRMVTAATERVTPCELDAIRRGKNIGV